MQNTLREEILTKKNITVFDNAKITNIEIYRISTRCAEMAACGWCLGRTPDAWPSARS